MPAISKIRLTNIVYEEGNKRYNDEVFYFDGHNGAIVLENGGGKTVFIHTVLQAVIPHTNLGDRKIKETLQLENAPAHIGIEWIKSENPRRYVTTCVTLSLAKDGLDSIRYVFEYDGDSPDRLEEIPFVHDTATGKRPAERGEIMDYYSAMKNKSMYAETFSTITAFRAYIEEQHHIIANEWDNIVNINGDEGGIDKFFESCRTTNDLYDRLLIPTVEGSIAGHEEGMFAEMFEKQRAGFHMYKKLSESMKENELIQQELDNYVDVFEGFTVQQTAYGVKKSDAKGYWNLLQHQAIELEKEQKSNQENYNSWQTSEKDYRWKEASFDIFLEKRKHEELKKTHKIALASYEEVKERQNQAEIEYHSLQYANLKQQLKSYQEQLEEVEEEISRKEKNQELPNYEEELEKTNRTLKGYFVEKQENLKKIIQDKKIELIPLNEQKELLSKKESKLIGEHRELQTIKAKLEERIAIQTDTMEKLKQEVLANPAQQDVHTEKDKWQKRHQFLDEEIIRLGQKEKANQHQLEALDNNKEELLKKNQNMHIELSSKQEKENELLKMHKELITDLSEIKPKWSTIVDLYMRESTIKEELDEHHKRLSREQEALLLKERIARRLIDDYENQEMFFGDVYLNQQLESLKNQFDYLLSGVEFYQSLEEPMKDRFRHYTFWPVTFITTKQSKSALLKKLKSMTDRTEMPVQVLTLEEIDMMENDGRDETWVVPQIWTENLDQEAFLKWKNNLKEQAEIVTENRRNKDEEITSVAFTKRKLIQFFDEYPVATRDQLKYTMKQIEKRISALDDQLKENQAKAHAIGNEQKDIQVNVQAFFDEKNGLEVKINKAYEFIATEKLLQENQKQLEMKVSQAEDTVQTIRLTTRQMERYQTDIDNLEGEKKDAQNEIQIMLQNESYQAVEKEEPIFTGEDRPVILQRRNSLMLAIKEIESSYNEWIVKKEYHTRDISKTRTEIEKLYRKHTEIDVALVFPPNGYLLMESLEGRIVTGEEKLEKLQMNTMEAKTKLDEQVGNLRGRNNQFNSKFPNQVPCTFTETISEIENSLVNEKKKLKEREAYINQESQRLEKESKQMQKAITELDKFEEAHYFNSSQIEGKVFTEDEITEFLYQRLQRVEAVTKALRLAKEKEEAEHENVLRAKRSFKQFCERSIQDKKLQKMAIDGIEQKENYQDILDFRKNMIQRLEHADKIARDYISNHDKDLQVFIDRIHQHLLHVKEELLGIPKKTRVKIDGKWKEIFKFAIPDWTVEDGKQRIREHIDWILDQLDSDRYINDHGVEDNGKVRHDIEKWLETKQLMQIVIDSEKVKVNCRKVTNDNQVSSMFFTWERSNKWSGGEKWSKNMTLFLGILNFVAEKKQHLTSSMKRNRAVILDNPFGRASSEHVLNPVFFIAEQLGFQIVALTAHAEGKFLQDYFPVLFSCKLRASQDPRKKIMTKEKTLHHAYFQEHDPDSLERLGEVEQMELL